MKNFKKVKIAIYLFFFVLFVVCLSVIISISIFVELIVKTSVEAFRFIFIPDKINLDGEILSIEKRNDLIIPIEEKNPLSAYSGYFRPRYYLSLWIPTLEQKLDIDVPVDTSTSAIENNFLEKRSHVTIICDRYKMFKKLYFNRVCI